MDRNELKIWIVLITVFASTFKNQCGIYWQRGTVAFEFSLLGPLWQYSMHNCWHVPEFILYVVVLPKVILKQNTVKNIHFINNFKESFDKDEYVSLLELHRVSKCKCALWIPRRGICACNIAYVLLIRPSCFQSSMEASLILVSSNWCVYFWIWPLLAWQHLTLLFWIIFQDMNV